jgi:hypothetical protein
MPATHLSMYYSVNRLWIYRNLVYIVSYVVVCSDQKVRNYHILQTRWMRTALNVMTDTIFNIIAIKPMEIVLRDIVCNAANIR